MDCRSGVEIMSLFKTRKEMMRDEVKEFNDSNHESVYQCSECGFTVIMPNIIKITQDDCRGYHWYMMGRHWTKYHVVDGEIVYERTFEHIPKCPFHPKTELKQVIT